MNEELQRIKIAEACGWKLKSNGLRPMWSWQNKSLAHRIKWVAHKEMASQGVLPDYLNDLNAMHEAERILNPILAAKYARILTSIAWESEQPVFAPMTASAAQRAEAFLKTLNLWKP
jgi:hypothetical protein